MDHQELTVLLRQFQASGVLVTIKLADSEYRVEAEILNISDMWLSLKYTVSNGVSIVSFFETVRLDEIVGVAVQTSIVYTNAHLGGSDDDEEVEAT